MTESCIKILVIVTICWAVWQGWDMSVHSVHCPVSSYNIISVSLSSTLISYHTKNSRFQKKTNENPGIITYVKFISRCFYKLFNNMWQNTPLFCDLLLMATYQTVHWVLFAVIWCRVWCGTVLCFVQSVSLDPRVELKKFSQALLIKCLF